MKHYFTLLYWCTMVLLVALVLRGEMESFGAALFLAVALLPGVLFFKFFVCDISFRNRRRGVINTVYFALTVMLIQYLGIALVAASIYYEYPFDNNVPRIVMNPLFLWLLTGALLSMEGLLRTKIFHGKDPVREKFITFISDRRKTSLELSFITFIESRDNEVEVATASGERYPTRMKISQWEASLDDRFVRIHRSFIVNREHIVRFDARTVWLGGRPIEISRKYRESTLEKLSV